MNEADSYLEATENVYRAKSQASVSMRTGNASDVDFSQAELINSITRKMTQYVVEVPSIESAHNDFVSKVSAISAESSTTLNVKNTLTINEKLYTPPSYTLPVI